MAKDDVVTWSSAVGRAVEHGNGRFTRVALPFCGARHPCRVLDVSVVGTQSPARRRPADQRRRP